MDLDPAVSERLRRNDAGLVPAIAQQHDTGEVLMLGWMDDEALARTLATGRARKCPANVFMEGRVSSLAWRRSGSQRYTADEHAIAAPRRRRARNAGTRATRW